MEGGGEEVEGFLGLVGVEGGGDVREESGEGIGCFRGRRGGGEEGNGL